MLVMFGGEFSNFVIYFLFFVNASIKDCIDLKGIFGFKWKFWDYGSRIKIV